MNVLVLFIIAAEEESNFSQSLSSPLYKASLSLPFLSFHFQFHSSASTCFPFLSLPSSLSTMEVKLS